MQLFSVLPFITSGYMLAPENANFFYAITLVWSLGLIMRLLQTFCTPSCGMSGSLSGQRWWERRPVKYDIESKV